MHNNQLFSPVVATIFSGLWFVNGIAALLNAMPAISTVIGIVWFIVMIWESATVIAWREHWRRRRIIKLQTRLARMVALEHEQTGRHPMPQVHVTIETEDDDDKTDK